MPLSDDAARREPDADLFSIKTAERVLDLPPGTISQRKRRGELDLEAPRAHRSELDLEAPREERGDVDSVVQGQPRFLSADTIVEIGIAEEFCRKAGLPWKAAMPAAQAFTVLGRVGTRLPGKPFPKGDTYLVAAVDGRCAILNVHPEPDEPPAIFAALRDADGHEQLSEDLESGAALAVIMNVGRLYERIRAGLDLPTNDYRSFPVGEGPVTFWVPSNRADA